MRATRLVLVAGVALLAAAPAAASPGTVDPTFGGAGIAPTPFGMTASAAGVARGPGGRLVITGDTAGAGVLVARFTPTGALDPTFAGTGSRIDRFGDGGEPPQRGGAVAVQPDGSVVVAGVSQDTWMLTRYKPDGSPDVLFGAGGVALRFAPGGGGFPAGTGPRAVAIAADGRIVVAGSSGVPSEDDTAGEQIVVARYSARGVPDVAFGTGGFATLQLGRGSRHRHPESRASGLALLADGRIVIAGHTSDRYGSERAFVARLTAAGGLDASFASGGRRLVQLGRSSATRRPASSAFSALAMRADGTLLAAGRASDVAGGDAVAVARVTPAGAIASATVTQLGAAKRPVRPQSVARTLALTSEGGAVAAGAATGGTLVARFDAASGRLSCDFGSRGRTLVPGGGGLRLATDGAASAVGQPDGTVVLAGRHPGGGVLLTRVLGGTAAAPAKAPPRLVSYGVRATKSGRGYIYGYLDGRCSTTRVRFVVKRPSGRMARTHAQLVRSGAGPQIVCARLGGVRAGRRYAIHMVSQGPAGAFQELKVARAVARPAAFKQDGCVR